jgi:hypothetical protein
VNDYRIYKALQVLENDEDWEAAKKKFADMVPMNHLMTDEHRKFYLAALRKVFERLTRPTRKGTIAIEVEREQQTGRGRTGSDAYVWQWVGCVIHIQPSYWSTNQDPAEILCHELGRLIIGISGDSGLGDTNNIQNWDSLIRNLSAFYDRKYENKK